MAKKVTIRVRSNDENLYQLVEVLDVLKLGVEVYNSGRKSAWMIVSAYLHQLLTDQSMGSIPLAARVMPDLKLHPMQLDISGTSSLLYIPVKITGSGLEVFDWSKPKISLDKWLNQIAYVQAYQEKGIPLSIQDLIREPRHQAGGAHYDTNVDEKMVLIEGILSCVQIGEQRMSYREYIVAIGNYVHTALNSELIGALGNGYVSQNNLSKAKEFFETAVSICSEVGDQQGLSEQFTNLGHYYYKQNDLIRSVKYYSDTLLICNNIGDTDAKPELIRNLMLAHLGLGNYLFEHETVQDAIKSYKLALGFSRQLEDIAHEIILLSNLGIVYSHIGNTEMAVASWLIPFLFDIDTDKIDTTDAGPIQPIIAKIAYNLAKLRKTNTEFDRLIIRTLFEEKTLIREATDLDYANLLPENVEDILIGLNRFLNEVPDRSK